MGIGYKVKKLFRTVQSEMAFLKEPKDSLYLHGRRLLRRPHEKDFWALSAIPDELPGCYVDIGANQGQSIESIKIVKPNASVISFEANAGLAAMLAKRYADRSDIEVRPWGLGNQNADAILYTPVYKALSMMRSVLSIASLQRTGSACPPSTASIARSWRCGSLPARSGDSMIRA